MLAAAESEMDNAHMPKMNQTHVQINFDHAMIFHFQFIEGWVETD